MSVATTSVVLPSQYVTVEEECERNPKLKQSDLRALMDWVREQPHLPKAEEQNEIYFASFLQRNDYHLEPTKRMIDEFLTVRTQIPEVFSNRDPIAREKLRRVFNVAAIVPLERRTDDNCIIVLLKILSANPRMFDTHECLKHFFMTCELLYMRIGTCEGQVTIIDASGLSFGYLTRVDLRHIKKLMHYVQEVVPIKLRAIHIVNTSYIVKLALNILRPFLNAKMFDILHFHTTLEDLKEFLPIEALPSEYGGKAESVMQLHARNIKILEENREWFLYDDTLRVNESLRINKF